MPIVFFTDWRLQNLQSVKKYTFPLQTPPPQCSNHESITGIRHDSIYLFLKIPILLKKPTQHTYGMSMTGREICHSLTEPYKTNEYTGTIFSSISSLMDVLEMKPLNIFKFNSSNRHSLSIQNNSFFSRPPICYKIYLLYWKVVV